MFRRVAQLLFVCLFAQVLGACAAASTTDSPPDGHRVNEAAIAAELHREFPDLPQNAAFTVQVQTIADLCTSAAVDFRINARSVGSADARTQLRRQIRAGCPWRSSELDKLFAEQAKGTNP